MASSNESPYVLSPMAELRYRLRRLPWWAIVLVALLVYAVFWIWKSEERRDIMTYMLDDPRWTTEDKYSSVYEVKTDVLVVRETYLVKLPNQERAEVEAADILSREAGILVCDQDAVPDCVNEAGTLIMFRVSVPEDEQPDGTYEERGVMRAFGNIVDLPDGSTLIVPEENILSREDGTLACNRILDADCEDLSGTIVTFEQPYSTQTGLLLRSDLLIRHPDGYEETIRPNRASEIEVVGCQEESTTCHLGEARYTEFRERVTGTEVERTNETIRVRTVDEQTEFVPRDRLLSIDTGLVECDREANPRCQNFEGTILEVRGAVTTGELTLESNRSLDIIPEGQVTSIEINKSDIVAETRNPENCRVEDAGACLITVQEEDRTVAGHIVNDTDEGLTIQTVEPVFVEFPRADVRELSRKPLVCARNNPRGCNSGLWLTLLVTFVAYGLALLIGLLVGLMRVSANPVLFHGSTLYVELVRGLPLLVLLLFFAFVVGPLIRDYDGPGSFLTSGFYDSLNSIEVAVLGEESFLSEAVLGLAIGYGAFLAEVFRAGIQSIGRGQMEAARSLGMSYFQAMRHVILPQAVRIILPPLGNDFIAMLKDSALISVLALPDLLQNGRLYISRTFQPIPVYIVVAILYIVLTMFLSYIVRNMERRMKLP